MEELTNMLINFVVNYGWQLAVCAVAGIFVLGFAKTIKIFDKISNAQVKKFLYILCAVITSVGASAVYLVIIDQFSWVFLASVTSATFALNQVIYALYENFGVRAVLQGIGNWIKKNIFMIGITAKKSNSAVIAEAKKAEPASNPNDLNKLRG